MKISNKSNNLKYMKMVLLVSVMLLISGCPGGDDLYATASEQYAMGWILHNINDSTSSVLNYSIDDVAIYNYHFNYPAYNPQYYGNVFFWAAPIPKWSGGIITTSIKMIAVPLDRVYYFMGKNPVPENYWTNWSFSNSIRLNYLIGDSIEEKAAYRSVNEEHYLSESAFTAITPVPGDTRDIYFGTSPFTPVSISIENNTVVLKDRLMKGYQGNSNLLKFTEIWVQSVNGIFVFYLDKPRYKIYLNNTLVEEKNITTFEEWDYRKLRYNLASDGEYRVEITIPSFYPLFNLTKITAEFSKPSDDMKPPELNHIEIAPMFKAGEQVETILDVSDVSGVSGVEIYYDEGNGWISVPINQSNPFYTSSFVINNESVDKVDLKIKATDNHGNSVTYEIFPATMKASEIELDLNLHNDDDLITRGSDLYLSGYCINEYGCYGLLWKQYINDEYLKSFRGSTSYTFYDNYKIPYDFDSTTLNMTFKFDGTGIYPPKEYSIIKGISLFEHDIGVEEIESSGLELNEPTLLSTEIVNIGEHDETNINVTLFIENHYGEVEIIESILIPQLNVGEVYDVIFNWTPQMGGNIEIIISAEHPLDEYEENNMDTYNQYIKPQEPNINVDLDLRDENGDYLSGGRAVTGEDYKLRISSYNNGGETATEVVADIYQLNDCEHFMVFEGETKVIMYNGVEYIISGYWDNYYSVLNVTYNNQTEEVFINTYGIVILGNGVVLSNSYISDTRIGLNICGLENNLVIDLQDIAPDDFITEFIDWSFTEPGDRIMRVFVNTTQDFDWKDNYDFDYVFVVESGPDITGQMDVDYNALIDEATNITILVNNDGTGNATNVNATVYEYEWEHVNGEWVKNITGTIGSVYFGELGVSEEKTDVVEWTPTEEGYYNLMLVVNASEDTDWENNYDYESAYVVMPGPNIGGWANVDYHVIVNETNNITIQVNNDGTENATNVNATVYKYENIYVNGEWVKNITGTIGSVYFGELGVSEEKTDVVEWTPTEQGYYRLILVVNASEDIDWENNYDYESAYVVMPGPNIEGWANVHYHVIVNETNNITLYVENEGTETSQNVTATVHEYELGYIDGESVEVIVDTIGGVYFGDVDAGEYKSDIIPWTPEEQRHYNLMLVVNASEDIDWENNYDYYGVQARYDGPDLSVYVPYPDNDLIANEVNPVEVEVYNHGTETATEVELTIYDLYNNQYTNIGYGAGVYYNEILYEFNLDWIADYLVNLTVNYNNITEQFTVVQDKTIILQNGVALAIDYISSERRLSLIFTEVSQVVTESVPNIGVYELWEGFVNITPTITGTHILAASVSSLNDISQYNDYDLRYVTVIEEGPNVYGDLYVEYDSIVNETNNITIEVGNVGTEIATNVNATVYEYEWEYVDGEDVMIIVDTIGSVYIGDLGVDQSTTEIIEWTPAEQRHYMFMLVVNSSWDVNPNNNIDYDSSYAQVSAPDLHIYITENDMGIVNQTGTISLEVRNTGIETATNVNSTLYNFYNCEYELIRFGDTETMYHNDVEYHISADWVFDEYAVFNVNYNNQTEQLLVYNNGYGVLSNNVFLTIRYSSESSLRFYMCEELEGVATQDIADIEPGYQNFVGLEMNWTPYTEGAHLLKIFVDANEDHYWADNVVTSNVNVVMPGPNMKANHIIINKVDKDTVIIINQSTVVYTSVSNVGTETANNVSVKLYLNYYGNDDEEDVEPGLPADPINETEGNETGGNSSSGGGSGGNETDEGAEPEVIDDDLEEITEEIEYSYLIDEYYLGDLEANEEALYNFTWTPNATGWETLALVVNSSYDVYDGNNVRYNSVRVRPNSSDILYYYYFPKQTMVNETYNLNIDLNNVGIVDAENVFIELRDNGVLLYSNFVGTLEVDDWFWDQYIWTPQYVGEHNMTFFMNYTDNTGYNEILDMETVNVLEPISVLMTINNPDGGYEPTTVVYDDWYYITEPTQLTMPNTSTNIGFLKLFNQDNDDEGVFTGFRDSTPQSEMTATSSVYYNLTDGGLFFNIVYANEVNWVTFQNEFEFRASNSWFEYDDNLALYQCTDFDFGTDSCVNGWDVADDYEFGSFSSNYLSVQGISFSPVEAFGVGYYVEDVNDTNVTVYERECLIILDPIYKNNCEYTPKYDSKGICLTGYDEQCNIAIIDAKWSESSVDDGNSVELIVECDNCEGEEVVFTIIENDLLVDNEIIELTGTIKDGVVTVDWEAEWVNDAFWPLSNDPEFYFEVNVGGETAFSPYLAVFSVSGNESQPPTVDSIDIQEGYEVTDYIWANGQLVAKVVEGNE